MKFTDKNMKTNNLGIQATDPTLTSNNISFMSTIDKNYTEILKLCSNGDIFVKGKLIENDKEVVDAMREFLKRQEYLNKK
jgi:hypothetical protein